MDVVGDINGDGVVNVLDIQAAIAQALQTSPGSALADIDGNSQVDIADVQNLINTSLGTGGLLQRVKGVLSAPADILQAGVTLAAVSQDGDQVVVSVDPTTGAFSIKLPVRKAWSFVFATVPDASGNQETGTVQFTVAGVTSTVLPLAELSQCDVLNLGTLTFGPVITVSTDLRDLLAHINKQELLADADGNGIPDFLDKLIDKAASLPIFDCNTTTEGEAPAMVQGMALPPMLKLPCIDFASVKSLIKNCIADNLDSITDVSLVDTNGNRIPDFLEPFLGCMRDGIKAWLQANGVSLPDQVVSLVMNAIGPHLPEVLGALHMPRLTDTNGDGIPDIIRFGVGPMHIPAGMDANHDGIPDFLQHRPPHPTAEGEGEPASEGEVEVQTAAVPDVAGMTLDDAKTAIAAAGFPLGAVGSRYSDTVPAGQVMVQRPEAGKTVPVNAPVSLVVSGGPAPAPVAVPDIVGMAQADAQTAVTSAGFVVGMVAQFHDAAVAQGLVIRQFPPAGTMVPPGAPVNFVVSLGAATAGTATS
jgi:hypothetical protein